MGQRWKFAASLSHNLAAHIEILHDPACFLVSLFSIDH
jgi:hypothetical protein